MTAVKIKQLSQFIASHHTITQWSFGWINKSIQFVNDFKTAFLSSFLWLLSVISHFVPLWLAYVAKKYFFYILFLSQSHQQQPQNDSDMNNFFNEKRSVMWQSKNWFDLILSFAIEWEENRIFITWENFLFYSNFISHLKLDHKFNSLFFFHPKEKRKRRVNNSKQIFILWPSRAHAHIWNFQDVRMQM